MAQAIRLASLTILACGVLAAVGAVVAPAFAQAAGSPADAAGNAGPRCVTLNMILGGEVVSSRELRFQMRGGGKLIVTLAGDCPQLQFHGRYTYQATGGRLCAGEGRIVARSGEACLIASFTAAEATSGGTGQKDRDVPSD